VSTQMKPTVVKADLQHVRIVTNVWAPFAIYCKARDPKWGWRWFQWDRIIPSYPTWAAVLEAKLEGLISYGILNENGQRFVKVHFLASAPWNYPPVRRIAGVGSGLLSRAASVAQASQVDLFLSSTPESEDFYEKKMKLLRTGKRDQEGLQIFQLPLADMAQFLTRYPPLEDAK
jgi:hypothetical protein